MPILTKEQVVEAAFELPEDERAEVTARLSGHYSPPLLSPEQERELDEALLEHEENPSAARSWNEVYTELRAKSPSLAR